MIDTRAVKYSGELARKIADIAAWPPELVAAKYLYDLGWRDDSFLTHHDRFCKHLPSSTVNSIVNYLRDFERGATIRDCMGRRRQYRDVPCV